MNAREYNACFPPNYSVKCCRRCSGLQAPVSPPLLPPRSHPGSPASASAAAPVPDHSIKCPRWARVPQNPLRPSLRPRPSPPQPATPSATSPPLGRLRRHQARLRAKPRSPPCQGVLLHAVPVLLIPLCWYGAGLARVVDPRRDDLEHVRDGAGEGGLERAERSPASLEARPLGLALEESLAAECEERRERLESAVTYAGEEQPGVDLVVRLVVEGLAQAPASGEARGHLLSQAGQTGCGRQQRLVSAGGSTFLEPVTIM